MVDGAFDPACTRIYDASDAQAIPEAVAALRAGQVVAFPTDTVYGVGCDLWQPEAVERLYSAKRRPAGLAIPVLVSASEDVLQVAERVPATLELLAVRFWPGGLTLVVPRRPEVPDRLCNGGPTIAVRMPDHPLAQQIITALGGALAVTSANISGRPAPRTAPDVAADLGGRIAVLIDGGECPVGVASTVVDLTTSPPLVLRQGGVPYDALLEVLPGLRPAESRANS